MKKPIYNELIEEVVDADNNGKVDIAESSDNATNADTVDGMHVYEFGDGWRWPPPGCRR